ncbi:MAG: acyl-CoA dehydrogenase family protein [Deltaproteobacteria bacterium]|nr:acyl-CoA dehydrogenase family protein [Deltaproteobacteria bacterium]MBW2384363.1 acyl-CoA dehydrogenase family protein [Deltaproteobacteria bacterium]MBW2697279.1 acyl-CoA dehydrogenase family protein [Deltaproteobacteria bacterium]
MDFNLTPEEAAFRDEVRAFLDENLDAAESERDMNWFGGWLKKVREKRWVGFSWPKEVGGGGGTVMQQVILKEEMAKRKAPPLGSCYMGLAWVGPSIIQYGNEEQKQKYIPDILDGTYQWCTGYSEPDSGSDLASLKCRCERDGDEYVVNGQKIWTSIAMISKMMILLVRTQTDVDVKHDGITCLLVEMDSPGIEVRPIKNMSGGAMFAEVFLTDVRVPVENRLGAEGGGWKVTVSALANERSSIAEVYGLTRKMEELKDLARDTERAGQRAIDIPSIRRRLQRAEIRIESMRLNGQRFLTKQLKGEPLGSETSINKLHRASLEVEMGELAMEITGSASTLMQGCDEAPEDGRWAKFALGWPEVVIGGGTPNIQKNIISERILGLPKD